MKTGPAEADETETGLPLLRGWGAVYAVVAASFCAWVLGLLALHYFFA